MTTHAAVPRRIGASLVALTVSLAVLLMPQTPASAAIVPTVPLGTSANYAVLGASTVTNTGSTILNGSLGLWPGTSITGVLSTMVLPPGRIDATNAAAKQAQSDLTVAYTNAAGRPIDATTTADLAHLKLGAGVYAGPSKSPLLLTGPLVLDGAGDPTSVFIFQTNSTLITRSGSTVTLINGAQECNVFWQVGSSATLGTGSVFVGNILALTSITVANSVTVHGRALARNAAVTLDNDTFTRPTCNLLPISAGSGPITPGVTTPGVTTPGVTTPGVTTPGVTTPGVTTPGTPGVTTPGVTTPGVTTTGAGTPGATTPRTETPGVRTPGVRTPGVRTPGVGTPGVGTPGVGTPGVGTPGVGISAGVPGVVGPPRTGGAPAPSATFPWRAMVMFTGLLAGMAWVSGAQRPGLGACQAARSGGCRR